MSRSTVTILVNSVLLALGSIVCAVAINSILIPAHFLAGGISGLSLVIHYLFPGIPVGAAVLVLNVPLFLVGWLFVGKRFFSYSLLGMGLLSGALFIPCPALPLADPLLQALTAGMVSGIGTGIILRSLGSSGGLDILSIILLKKFSVRIGTTFMIFNTILMLVSLSWFDLQTILYTVICIFVTSQMINIVVTGLNQRKAVMIISPKSDAIADAIMENTKRGVTIVNGEGGYSKKKLRLLYTIITFRELSRFKALVRQIDPDAFVVISETLEVMGRGRIGNQPHW